MHALNMHAVFRWNPAARRHFGAEFTWHPGDAASCQLLRLAATVRETNLAYLGCLSCRVGGEAAHAGDEFCLTTCHFLCWETKILYKDKWKSNLSCFIAAEEVRHVTTEQSDNNQMDVGDACGTSTSRQEHVSSGLLKCHEVSSLVAVCGQTLALVLTLYLACKFK